MLLQGCLACGQGGLQVLVGNCGEHVSCLPSFLAPAELQGFCKDVSPAGGEAFKCLQGNLEDIRMGAACKGEVNLQELRHASNYRLDVRVRTECAADVEKFCKDADAGDEGHALVLKCMVQHNSELTSSCQTEVSEKEPKLLVALGS